jgi:hypothetical protein
MPFAFPSESVFTFVGILNRYAYALNNPLRNIDPSGLGNCTTYSGVDSQGNYWITIYCTYYSGVIVINVPGGPPPNLGQTGGGSSGGGAEAAGGGIGSTFACASEAASKVSIAGALQRFAAWRLMSSAPRPNASMWLAARASNAPTCTVSRYPTAALQNPQTTLTVAEESPWPGGFAKGVWKGRPIVPATKCGTAFAAKTPPKK